jgi:hypothetical protein
MAGVVAQPPPKVYSREQSASSCGTGVCAHASWCLSPEKECSRGRLPLRMKPCTSCPFGAGRGRQSGCAVPAPPRDYSGLWAGGGRGLYRAGCPVGRQCPRVAAHGGPPLLGGLRAGTLSRDMVGQLDRMLLILMIVEILYTVQVSFREHVLTADPFLIVALIAATRRILVLTAEFSEMRSLGETAFRNAMIEMGVLTVMMLVLVVSLFLLRKPHVERTIARE